MSVTTAEPVQPAETTAAAGVRVGRASAWWVLIAGIIGLTAAATLLIEKIEMLKDPAYVPSCSITDPQDSTGLMLQLGT